MSDETLVMKDRLGNPVSVGDRVVYATLSGRDSRLVMTTVAGCFVDQAGVQHPLFMLLGRVRSLEPSEFVKVSTEYLDPQSDCAIEPHLTLAEVAQSGLFPRAAFTNSLCAPTSARPKPSKIG